MTHPATHSRLAQNNDTHLRWPLGSGASTPNTVSRCGGLPIQITTQTITTGLLRRNAADSEGSRGVGDRGMTRYAGWQVSPYPVTDRQGPHDEKGPHNIGRTQTFPSVPTNSRTLPPRCIRGV